MSDADIALARAAPDPHKHLHLDSEYTRHYQLFCLNDGRVEDSRLKNWREVEWEKVVRIVVHIKGREHTIAMHPTNHQFFLSFRNVILGPTVDDQGKIVLDSSEGQVEAVRQIQHTWTVGVTDGKQCFLQDFDFHTGSPLNSYILPIREVVGHIHPRILALDKLYKSLN